MNESLTKILARFQAASRKAKLEEQQMETYLHLLPYGLVYERVHPSNLYRSQASVHIKVDRLEDIQGVVELLKPDPMALVKGACTSFRPIVGGVIGDRETSEHVFGIVVDAGNVSPPTPTLNARWYATVGLGTIIRVEVEVKEVKPWCEWEGTRRMRQGQVYIADELFVYRMHPTSQVIRWGKGSPEYFGSYTFYWAADAVLVDILDRSKTDSRSIRR